MNSSLSQIAPEILKVIKESKNILLHLHPRPDGDSVGSSLSMYQVLKGMGKNVTLIKGDSVFPTYLSHLPMVSEITPKNIFEIDLSQFDLFIIQDSSNYEKVTGLGEFNPPASLKKVVIDHHSTNASFGDINFVDSSYIAVCEMLSDLFTEWGIEITHDIATCLFVGIYTDSGGFKYKNISERTFLSLAKLIVKAPDISSTLGEMDSSNTIEKLRYEGLALLDAKGFLGDTVGISGVSHQSLVEHNIPKEEAKAEIANILRTVSKWKIGISLVEEEPGEVKVSMRSRDGDKYDVSKIVEILGGGGHKAAAGCLLKMDLQEAVAKVVSTIEAVYGKKLN